MKSWKLVSRDLWKYRSYTAVNTLGLAVGLSCFTVALLYYHLETSYDTWDPGLQRVYRVSMLTADHINGNNAPAPLGDLLMREDPDIAAVTKIIASGTFPLLISAGGKQLYQTGVCFADSNFFQVFPYTLDGHRSDVVLNSPNEVVISKAVSRKFFGPSDPVGKELVINNMIHCVITAVLESPATPSHLDVALVVRDPWMARGTFWGNYSYTTYVRTRSAKTTTALEKAMNNSYYEQRVRKDSATYSAWRARGLTSQIILDPVWRIHNFPQAGPTHYPITLSLLLFASVLLLSCAVNFSNLTLAAAISQAKELALRKVLGASKTQLVSMFVMKIGRQCLFSLLLSIWLTGLVLPWFNQQFGTSLSLWTSAPLTRIVLQLLTAVILLALLSALYPSLILLRFNAARVLKGSVLQGVSSHRLSQALIVVQIVAAFSFLLFTLTSERQTHYLRDRDPGFTGSQVLRIEAQQQTREAGFEAMRSKLLSLPGVSSVAKSTQIPGGLTADTSTTRIRYLGGQWPVVSVKVSVDFFRTLNIPLVEGRLFSYDRPVDQDNTAIINESAATLLVARGRTGSSFTFPFCDSVPYTIVGIVKDVNTQNFESAVKPTVYSISNAHCGYNSGGAILVKLDQQRLPATVDKIAAAWKTIEPAFPMRYSFLDQDFAHYFDYSIRLQWLFLAMSVVAILIAFAGLLALMAFLIGQRQKQLSIRKVLGGDFLRLSLYLTVDFMRLICLGVLIACPLAWYGINRWLQGYAYRMPIHPWPFVLAAAIIFAIAWATIGWQGMRAARVSPIKHLRNE